MAHFIRAKDHRPLVQAGAAELRCARVGHLQEIRHPSQSLAARIGKSRWIRRDGTVVFRVPAEREIFACGVPGERDPKTRMPAPKQPRPIAVIFEKKIVDRMPFAAQTALTSRSNPRLD